MPQSRSILFLCSAAIWLLIPASQSDAAIAVFGDETSPGNYSFTFQQVAGIDPIQTKSFVPINFTFDETTFTVNFGSPTGTISDGTVTLNPGGTGWADSGAANSFNPNLIIGGTTITATSTAGIDFANTVVNWRFTSAEFFGGTPLTGRVFAVPEPSFAGMLFLSSAVLLARRRTRRQSK